MQQNRKYSTGSVAAISNTNLCNKYDCYKPTIVQVPVEYVFLDNQNQLRSKCKTLDFYPKTLDDIPLLELSFDYDPNSQDLQSITHRRYKPVAMYDDPFRVTHKGKLVFCESPTRQECKNIMDHYAYLEPWFGMEQEYVLFNPKTNRPLGWPVHGEPETQVK